MTDKASKTELMDRIAYAYEALERTLAGLDETQMARPDPTSGWTIKDHLFHLALWERGVAWLMTGRSRYEGMGITAQEWRDLEMDQGNDLVYKRHRERPPAEALTTFRDAHREMLEALAPLGDDDLLRPYADYDVAERLWPDRPILGWIAGDTYEHFAEHLGYIQAIPAQSRTSEQ